jgi:hypothetical protein
MLYVYAVASGFLILCILFQAIDLIKIKTSMRWFLQHTQLFGDAKQCDIEPVPVLLLLPMYKEAEICREAISYFSNLEYDLAYLKIVIISSGRELQSNIVDDINDACSEFKTLEKLKQYWPTSLTQHFSVLTLNQMAMCSNGSLLIFRQKLFFHIASKNTTVYEVEQAISKLNDRSKAELFVHIVTDGADQLKPDQLNYFIDHKEHFLEERWHSDSTYIGVFDSDARPDIRCLWAVARQVQNNNALVMQLVPLFVRNVFPQKYSVSNLYTGARSLFNTQFCLSYELPAMRASCSSGVFPLIWSGTLLHLFGSGEFIRYDLIRKMGFHNPSADTLIGYLCSYGDVPIFPVPLINLGETPENLKKLYYQGIVWFNGVVNQAKVARHNVFSLGFSPSVPRCLMMRYRRTFYNLCWWFFPHVILVVFIVCLIFRWVDLAIALSILVIMQMARYLLAIKFVSICKHSSIFNSDVLIPTLSMRQKLIMLILWPIERLIATASPISYYFLHLLTRDVPLKKTERKAAAINKGKQ